MAESIKNIESTFKEADIYDLKSLCEVYKNDERAGVQKILFTAKKRMDAFQLELDRIYQLKEYERQYEEFGIVCGIDEVGRGPLAGPVVACAIILPKDCSILYINDSKKLSAKKREELYEIIKKEAISIGIGYSSPERIDEINILQATYEAMREAINHLEVKPDILLNDAVTIPNIEGKQIPIIKGDTKSISIAAASIVAKVTRDQLMMQYDEVFPGYDFASNKGYGSTTHIEALKKLGKTPIHRVSFIKNFLLS
ncbi:MAG: ribonuclease HII [Lachnospiraceae bacterium]